MNQTMEEYLSQLSFDGIRTSVTGCNIEGFETQTVIFHLPEMRRVLSTRDGFQKVQSVGENICPEGLWNFVHANPKEFRQTVLNSLGDEGESCSLLYTGADPRQWALELKHSEIMVFLTVDVRTNAMRTGSDTPRGIRSKSPGTINIFLFTENELSDAAMSRSIITITEAKTAALQDNYIRSSYNDSLIATGTGTDNVIIIPGNGEKTEMLRGHSSLSLAIGETVFSTMNTAIKAGNKQVLSE